MSKFYGDTAMGGFNGRFPTTKWTMILNPAQRESILAELCSKYWKPLYHYLRCKGFTNAEAKDLVQGFFTEKVLGKEFIQKSDKTRGKFRNFLLVALKNYTIDIKKKDKLPQKHPENAQGPIGISDPENEFNRVWADDLLQEVLKELETECYKKGKITHWGLFHEWLIEPQIDKDKTCMSNICTKYDITDAPKAYNMISNLKKRFRAILRDHLRSLAESEEDVDDEIRKFISIFSRNPTIF